MSKVNGCGPAWMPEKVKDLLFNWFFEASCNKHDEGYRAGGNEFRRWECDIKFFKAMLKDSLKVFPPLVPFAILEAFIFYILVALFGWTRFNYSNTN